MVPPYRYSNSLTTRTQNILSLRISSLKSNLFPVKVFLSCECWTFSPESLMTFDILTIVNHHNKTKPQFQIHFKESFQSEQYMETKRSWSISSKEMLSATIH